MERLGQESTNRNNGQRNRTNPRYVIIEPEAYSTEPFIQQGQRPGFYRPENRRTSHGNSRSTQGNLESNESARAPVQQANEYVQSQESQPSHSMDERAGHIEEINTGRGSSPIPAPQHRTREDEIEERVRNEYWPIFSAIRLTARLLNDRPSHVSAAGLPLLQELLTVVGSDYHQIWLDGIPSPPKAPVANLDTTRTDRGRNSNP